MSRDKDRLAHYLEHVLERVLEAIRRIARYTVDMSEQEFMKNEITQDALIRNIEIIGESCHRVEVHYPEFASANPALPLGLSNAQCRGSRLLYGGS